MQMTNLPCGKYREVTPMLLTSGVKCYTVASSERQQLRLRWWGSRREKEKPRGPCCYCTSKTSLSSLLRVAARKKPFVSCSSTEHSVKGTRSQSMLRTSSNMPFPGKGKARAPLFSQNALWKEQETFFSVLRSYFYFLKVNKPQQQIQKSLPHIQLHHPWLQVAVKPVEKSGKSLLCNKDLPLHYVFQSLWSPPPPPTPQGASCLH